MIRHENLMKKHLREKGKNEIQARLNAQRAITHERERSEQEKLGASSNRKKLDHERQRGVGQDSDRHAKLTAHFGRKSAEHGARSTYHANLEGQYIQRETRHEREGRTDRSNADDERKLRDFHKGQKEKFRLLAQHEARRIKQLLTK